MVNKSKKSKQTRKKKFDKKQKKNYEAWGGGIIKQNYSYLDSTGRPMYIYFKDSNEFLKDDSLDLMRGDYEDYIKKQKQSGSKHYLSFHDYFNKNYHHYPQIEYALNGRQIKPPVDYDPKIREQELARRSFKSSTRSPSSQKTITPDRHNPKKLTNASRLSPSRAAVRSRSQTMGSLSKASSVVTPTSTTGLKPKRRFRFKGAFSSFPSLPF